MRRRTRFRIAALACIASTACGPGESADSTAPPPARYLLADTVPLSDALVAARTLYDDGELRESLDRFIAIGGAAAERNDAAIEAEARTFACFANRRLGQLEDGRTQCERAIDVAEANGLSAQRVIALNGLGLIAWLQSRLPEAASLYNASADLARTLGDVAGEARAEGNLGLVLVEYGEFEEARRRFTVFRDAGRALDRPTYEANALTNLGMLAIWTGDPASAFEPLDEARRIYRSIDDTYYEVNAIGQLAAAWSALGRHDRALIMIDSALARATDLDQRQEVASNLAVLADIARASGDHAEALRMYERALSLNEAAGYRLENAATLRAQAEILFSLGDTTGAGQRVERALRLHLELESPLEIMRDHLVLAELAAAEAAFDRAHEHVDAASSLLGRLEARLPRAEVAIGEATVLDREGDSAGVLRVLDRAAADLQGIGYGLAWQADVLRARALARLGRYEQSAEAAGEAVRTIESQRLRIGSERRTSFLARRLDAYSVLVESLLALGQIEEAFEISDAARGRSFLDHMASASVAARNAAGLPVQTAAAAAVDNLSAAIDTVLAQAPHERDAETLDTLESRLASSLGRTAPAVATSLLGGPDIDAGRIRAALHPGEALIEYFIADSGAVAFVVTADTVRLIPLDLDAGELALQTRIVRDLLSAPGGGERAHEILGRLYATLVTPILQTGVEAKRWFLVPHGPLAYIPFGALRNAASNRFLLEDRLIVVLPSAASLPILRSRSAGAWLPAGASAFAPDPSGLPATAVEARLVARTLPGGQAVLGDAATESELRRHLGGGRSIIHVAGHAVLHAENPLRSWIELADPGTRQDDDGHLELQEVLALQIDSRLVFLSGCETGAGVAFSSSFTRADDYATLAQAFLFAGADNVIATLWRIEDEGAAEFARRFYHHLPETDAAEALARAQREMLADDRFQAPFYWAAYQLAGADRAGKAQTAAALSVRNR